MQLTDEFQAAENARLEFKVQSDDLVRTLQDIGTKLADFVPSSSIGRSFREGITLPRCP